MSSPVPADPVTRRESIAVVGSGVSGLTAAYLLSRHHDVTLYEREGRLGGHAHTHTVPSEVGEVRVDSGFIVHNDRTYPHLQRLFGELGIEVRDTEMSMSIRDEETGLEYAGGRGIGGILAKPGQLARSDFRSLLLGVRRFHRLATQFLERTDDLDQTTFGQFLARHRFSADFERLYAVPVVSCVWSSGRGEALDYPARYLFRFLQHHGLLSIGNSPTWRTVVGGSATYVDAVAQHITTVHRGMGAVGVRRLPAGVLITADDGHSYRHDRVVLATHADQALALLEDPTPAERDVLGAFRYSRNETVLHRDGSLLPHAKGAKASWNYLVPAEGAESKAVVTYWMNKLQGLDRRVPLFVTLNATDRIDPTAVIARMDYTHPIYDLRAIAAQRRLPELTTPRTTYAGAYHGWGFHEDGCRSGVAAAEAFGVTW